MNDLAQRHSGTLGGRLIEPGSGRPVAVLLLFEAVTVDSVAVQHTAWMLTNLLARLVDVVEKVVIGGANGNLHNRVIPFRTNATNLQEALVEAAALIDGVPVNRTTTNDADIIFTVGPGGPTAPHLRVYGEGFCGAISDAPIESLVKSELPFGPYVAASLAASETFRQVRLPPDLWLPMRSLSLSAWDYRVGPGVISASGTDFHEVCLEFGLAGVGAVGAAAMHTLWACPGIFGQAVIADADQDGVDTTNFNRCVTFHRHHVGLPKASTAAEVLGGAGLTWMPIDGRYQRSSLDFVPDVLLSAVDTNRSRNDLQQSFWPARLIGASTKDLRAEVLRCGPPGAGQCLRCYNPPQVDIPDDVVRERLREMDSEQLARFAVEISQPLAMVHRWAHDGGCGQVGDAAINHAHRSDEPPAMFSVGFVSVLAGTFLAAEVIKEHLGRPAPLDDHAQSAKFQFWNPAAALNGRPRPTRRDPRCPACLPTATGVAVWSSRASEWAPTKGRELGTT